MKLNNNTDFFSRKLNDNQDADTQSVVSDKGKIPPASRQDIKFSGNTLSVIRRTKDILKACGLNSLITSIDKIQKDAVKDRFLVSVVGEFSRGKSTFLNNLLDYQDMLPIGDLPTTAMLTRIRYSSKPQIAVFDDKGNRLMLRELTPNVWQGLTVNVTGGKDPKGVAYIGIPNDWLGRNNLEFIDCPGAGDLSEERAKQIGDALNRTDGAIIAISAMAVLSNTERLFIKQRIVERKTPFAMLVITKLDQVNIAERCKVVKHVMDVLSLNKFDIPVYIPYKVEMPDSTYDSIMGLDTVKDAIISWIENPDRQNLIEQWLLARVSEVIKMAISILQEQQKLLRHDETNRIKKISEQRVALQSLALDWGDISLQLQQKGNECYELFLAKAKEYEDTIVEKLQFDVAHSTDPKKWLTEDYPYRLKMELANMSVALENVVVRQVNQDAQWFNSILESKFKTLLQVGNMTISDKTEFMQSKSENTLELGNISKKANMARIGTVALSIAGYFMLGPGMGILATMGIGASGAILSSKMVKNSLEAQRNEIKTFLRTDVPVVVSKAMANSEKRVLALYDTMLKDNETKLNSWVEAQEEAIKMANMSDAPEQAAKLNETISKLSELINN